MTPGTILFDSKFKFEDGKTGEKLFVALNDGSNGVYICVKTTSKDHRYNRIVGCQAADRFPNFYLPKAAGCLSKDTWIQLETFYEFDTDKLIQKVMNREIDRIGVLADSLALDLIVCATHSDDLSRFQEDELARQLKALKVAAAAPAKTST